MPLKAKDEKGQIVYAWNAKKGVKYFCPHCGGEMIFVDAVKKIKHFRHKAECPFDVESESLEHEFMKYYVFNWLRKLNGDADIEVRIGEHIADVVSGDVVVEVQASNISLETAKSRFKTYTINNYYTMWLFSKDFIEFRKWFIVRSEFRKFLLNINKSFLFFLDPYSGYLKWFKLIKEFGKKCRVKLNGNKYLVVNSGSEKLDGCGVKKYEMDGFKVAIPKPKNLYI